MPDVSLPLDEKGSVEHLARFVSKLIANCRFGRISIRDLEVVSRVSNDVGSSLVSPAVPEYFEVVA